MALGDDKVSFATAGRRPLVLLALLGCLALLASLAPVAPSAQAHFLLNVNLRVFHVEHLDEGLRVYTRLPLPYLVGDKIAAELAEGSEKAAPYTTNHYEGEELMHYVDVDAVLEDPIGLGEIAAERYVLSAGGEVLVPRVEAVRVYPSLEQPVFATLEQARAALQGPAYPDETAATYVGDTLVDVALLFDAGRPVYDYSLADAFDPGLPGQEETETLLHDHLADGSQTYSATGLLLGSGLEVSRQPLAAAWTFVVQGIKHILEGIDHVLFVLCLTIGASGLINLLWRVTGFTLGHTVTLIAGFLGYVPSAGWFIPLVETGIALSIIYAGAIAVLRRPAAGTFLVTTGIGLLHGFGFSFVLQEILSLEAPNLWPSLLAFNLGVEVGQVMIVLAIWPLLLLADRRNQRIAKVGRWAVAAPCILVAIFWAGERALQVIEAVS